MSSKSNQKITIKEIDTIDIIKRIIKNKKLEALILESNSACGLYTQLQMNQKTYWIAQNLALYGWKIDKLKHYKGKLLKVILSLK